MKLTWSLGYDLFRVRRVARDTVRFWVGLEFTASAFRKLPSVYVFSYFPFGFEGRMWDLIVSVPDHCLSFYLR